MDWLIFDGLLKLIKPTRSSLIGALFSFGAGSIALVIAFFIYPGVLLFAFHGFCILFGLIAVIGTAGGNIGAQIQKDHEANTDKGAIIGGCVAAFVIFTAILIATYYLSLAFPFGK